MLTSGALSLGASCMLSLPSLHQVRESLESDGSLPCPKSPENFAELAFLEDGFLCLFTSSV
jgi:hypothetical protein